MIRPPVTILLSNGLLSQAGAAQGTEHARVFSTSLLSTGRLSSRGTGTRYRQQARPDLPLTGRTAGILDPVTPPEGLVTIDCRHKVALAPTAHSTTETGSGLSTRTGRMRRSPWALPPGVSRSGQPPRLLLGLGSLSSLPRGTGGRYGQTFLSLVALQGY